MPEPASTLITIYITNWCPDCRRTVALLDVQHVPYNKVDIDQSPEGRAMVEKLNHGNRSVPTLVFPDGSLLVEPSNAKLLEKLNSLQR
jgi:glutaredoxin-like protein